MHSCFSRCLKSLPPRLNINGDQFDGGVSEAKNRPEFPPQLCMFRKEAIWSGEGATVLTAALQEPPFSLVFVGSQI